MKKLYFMTYFNEMHTDKTAILWGRLKARMGGTINSHRLGGEPLRCTSRRPKRDVMITLRRI
jgi:hypothetical protein